MAQVDNRSRDGRWSLEGTTALVTGGTKGIGFFFLSALSFTSFYFQIGYIYIYIYIRDSKKYVCLLKIWLSA
jgi:hypothetical protein